MPTYFRESSRLVPVGPRPVVSRFERSRPAAASIITYNEMFILCMQVCTAVVDKIPVALSVVESVVRWMFYMFGQGITIGELY